MKLAVIMKLLGYFFFSRVAKLTGLASQVFILDLDFVPATQMDLDCVPAVATPPLRGAQRDFGLISPCLPLSESPCQCLSSPFCYSRFFLSNLRGCIV